jgi:hypothetical protein
LCTFIHSFDTFQIICSSILGLQSGHKLYLNNKESSITTLFSQTFSFEESFDTSFLISFLLLSLKLQFIYTVLINLDADIFLLKILIRFFSISFSDKVFEIWSSFHHKSGKLILDNSSFNICFHKINCCSCS